MRANGMLALLAMAGTAQADARAFAALMRHLRDTDRDGTVLMMQVENEIGMIPEARDRTPAADAAFAAAGEAGRFVPARRMNGDQTHQGRHVRLPPEDFSVQRMKAYRYR